MTNFTRPEYDDVERTPLLKLVPDSCKRVLDIGCNLGRFGYSLKRDREVEVWGVEPDKDCAEVASTRLDKVINDYFSDQNPIPESYFDLITFNDSIEHMVDPEGALKTCKNILRKEGRIHCSVPNMRYIQNLLHLVVEKDWRYEEQGIRDRTHLRFFTEKSVIRLFKESGYNVVRVERINENWWEESNFWIKLLFKLFPSFTADMRHVQIVVIAELA